MKTLLYIGNKLDQTNTTVTTIDTLSKNLQTEGYHVITTSNKKNKILRLFDMLWHVVKHKNKVDYVLIDTYSTLNFYYAYLCSKLCVSFKLKYIPILHGGDLPKRLENSPKLSKAIFNNAYVNIAPSAYIKTSFENLGYNNLICIPNTIEIKNYAFKKRKIEKLKLLWVRAFSNIYNPILAVKIANAIQQENIDVEICMVGPDKDGSLQEVKTLAEKLNIDIKFTGKLSKEEWINLSTHYNIFINTTNVDNTPVSVIEAMALGLPVISTNVGGLPYLINDAKNGVLVKPNDEEEFVKAIFRLMENEDLVDEISFNARRKVKQFDWQVVKHKWFSVLS